MKQRLSCSELLGSPQLKMIVAIALALVLSGPLSVQAESITLNGESHVTQFGPDGYYTIWTSWPASAITIADYGMAYTVAAMDSITSFASSSSHFAESGDPPYYTAYSHASVHALYNLSPGTYQIGYNYSFSSETGLHNNIFGAAYLSSSAGLLNEDDYYLGAPLSGYHTLIVSFASPSWIEFSVFASIGDQGEGYGEITATINNISVNPVPLPPSIFLAASGLVGLAGWRRFVKG